MNISNLRSDVYRWPRPHQIANGSNVYGDGVLLLLTVETEAGISGKGWLGGTAAERPLEMFTDYVAFYRKRVLGSDALDAAAIFRRLEAEHIKTFGASGAHCQVSGALNAALWDIRGQHEKKPVHELLSGEKKKRRVRAYIAGGYYYGDDGSKSGIDRLRGELRANVDELGARSVKIKVGNPSAGVEVDRMRVEASRDEIGPDVELMVDANCAFKDAETAIAYAKAFEPYDIFWMEEPFRPDAFDLHRQLGEATSIPIATGENISTVPHFRELIRQRSLGVVNSDVAIMTGGYDAGMEVARIAKENGCILAPHGCQELQCHYVAAADEMDGRLEIYPKNLDPQRDKVFPKPFTIADDGCVDIPDEPGIGWVPDVEALAPYRVKAPRG
ncbi:MAG: mandelate racemase/muconate lactonizing enzyme family protein [Planctomycetes bacterium]|nr:mandelate racemase/muconate lactonizing enzyme family protein [Planctomycetota bacterium]